MTSPATFAPSLPDDVALPAELARIAVVPADEKALLRQLERAARIAARYKALFDATHEVIARLALHGQDTMRPKVTQDRVALALGVTGPRVNAIVKAARTRHGDPPPTDRKPLVDTSP